MDQRMFFLLPLVLQKKKKMMMAHSSQTRIVGKVDGHFCMLVGGCRDRFLMRTPTALWTDEGLG